MNNVIIDSSGWLEYFTDSKNANFFSQPIHNNNIKIIVPVIIVYEIFKKILTEKDEDTALNIIAQLKEYTIEEIDENAAISAAKISMDYKIPMADSLIYACTIKYNAILWTQDKDFKNLKNVKYIEK